MTFQFRKAVRAESPLLIGIAGGTGAGKTYSALRLAKGMGGKVAMIDTERGRGLHYADEFDYQYLELEPPFSPERYLEAMQAAENAGADIIIVDSMSHCWEGIGGLQEQAHAIAKQMAEKWGGSPERHTFPSWAQPKAENQKMVNWMLAAKANIILCFRAKEKSTIVKTEKDGRTRTEVVNVGWQPITEKSLPYEMTVLAMLTAENPGHPEFNFKALSHNFAGIFTGAKLDEETGQRIAAWAKGSAEAPDTTELEKAAEEAANGGEQALKEWWESITKEQRKALAGKLPGWKKIAAAADQKDTTETPSEDTSVPGDKKLTPAEEVMKRVREALDEAKTPEELNRRWEVNLPALQEVCSAGEMGVMERLKESYEAHFEFQKTEQSA